MTDAEFNRLFQTCVERDGGEYRTARDAILAQAPATRAQIAAKLAATDSREQGVAQMLLGWIDQTDLWGQVLDVVRGRLTGNMGGQFLGGTMPPMGRARSLAAMGTAIVPRLLEIMLKTREYGDSAGLQAIIQAIELLRDDRTVRPLVDLVAQSRNDQARVFALAALGTLRDPQAFDAAQGVFANRANSPELRSAAAVALGRLADRRATAGILSALQDPTEHADVRRYAARALGYMGDPAATSALAALLRTDQPPEFALTIVQSLGKLGDQTALAALDAFRATTTDDTARRAADEARRTLLA
jgi:HEAT repeat protein